MTSLDIRNNSAVMKRAEQLKRWEESDTNQQPPVPRPERGSRIKFSSGCIFLAACLAGDKDEVLKLIEQGADINTANVDGLTALHQACIDDNLEMVEFLVEQGADINRQDNEGWTPLHATASCGFVSIARYLVEHGADVAAVNSDGDLAVDLAVDIQHMPMIDFMQKMVAEQEVDCVKARKAEEQQMLTDAKNWLRSDASEVDRPHPKTGATALHVAAAKGYTKVLSLLLAGRANVDAQDNDGWTPLHAAAHWGQKEAAEMLLDAMADMDKTNYAAQTCIEVADRKMVKFLEEYRANNKRIKRRPSSQISRISDTIENHMDKAPTKFIRVEVVTESNKDHANDEKTSAQKIASDKSATEDEAPWRRSNNSRVRPANDSPKVPEAVEGSKTTNTTTNATESSDVILRRTQSFENDEKKSPSVSPSVTSTTPASATTSASNVGTTNTLSPAAVTTTSTLIRRSFVPPVRDEESETQRKAHAKRVRETRRSTQGVTLDEIKSAEELVKKKNSTMNSNNNNNNNNSSSEMQVKVTNELTTTTTSTTMTTTTTLPTAAAAAAATPAPAEASAATTTTTSTTTTTNSSSESATQQKEKENAEDDGVEEDDDDDDDITASFTIIAPAKRSRPASLVVCENSAPPEEEVTASFVLTRKESRTPTPTSRTGTPTEHVETTIVIAPAKSGDQGGGGAALEEGNLAEPPPDDKVDSPSRGAAVVSPATGDDSQPAATSATLKMRPPSAQREESSDRVRIALFSPLPIEQNSTAAANASNASTPTLDSPVRLRDKRSIFDLDNASSLSLADKLRQEVNRYGYDEKRGGVFAASDESGTDRDHSMSPLLGNLGPIPSAGYNAAAALSASLPNSPQHKRDRESSVSDTSIGGGGNGSGSGSGSGSTNAAAADRRPSWRLKFGGGSKFKLEDANAGNTYPPTNSTIIPSAPAVLAAANSMPQRRINSINNANSSSNQSLNSIGRPVSAPPTSSLSNSSNNSSSTTAAGTDDKSQEHHSTSTSIGSSASATSSYATRRASANSDVSASSSATNISSTSAPGAVTASSTSANLSNKDDKDNDKENDNRSALATQAVIQRRRKPKRRSTGVVHIDMDELDPDKQDSANDNEEKEKESGSEIRNSRSRAGSTVSTVSVSTSTSATDDKKTRDKPESSGDNIDYKALWEAAKLENDKLKQQLKKKDEEVVQTRATLERFANATTKNSLSEIEKRERRAMERKLSELEEELKQLDAYKTENLRLKEENGALIRVISKLSK